MANSTTRIGRALLALAGSVAFCALSAAQNCPVEILTVNPIATSTVSRSALRIDYRNESNREIASIIFNARVGAARKIIPLAIHHPVAPGSEVADQWADTKLLPSLITSQMMTVWPSTVIFSNGTEWLDGGRLLCARIGVLGADAAFGDIIKRPKAIESSSTATLDKGPAASPQSAQTSLSAQGKLDLIHSGKASLCIIRSYPPGASILVDGAYVGKTPQSVVLRKTEEPRDVFIQLNGYDFVERSVTPDGSTIPITVTLKPSAGK
jgi:hypothetical protein